MELWSKIAMYVDQFLLALRVLQTTLTRLGGSKDQLELPVPQTRSLHCFLLVWSMLCHDLYGSVTSVTKADVAVVL